VARALESAGPKRSRLFEDPFAAGLLFSLPTRLVAHAFRFPPARIAVAAYYEHAFPGVMGGLVTRTRYLDEAFEESVANVEQCAILGVGLDCRARRLEGSPHVPVFEVDRPANLLWKRSRLPAGEPVRPVVEAPIDFETESLGDALGRAGFDSARPTFFIWEGVTQYLSREAVDATLGFVASCAPGCRLAFSYIVPEGLKSESATGAAAAGEPWLTTWEPEGLAMHLQGFGMTVLEDVGHEELRARFLDPLGRRDSHWEVERIALVESAGR
jgi:methyltransferase (TIGR00027 family)